MADIGEEREPGAPEPPPPKRRREASLPPDEVLAEQEPATGLASPEPRLSPPRPRQRKSGRVAPKYSEREMKFYNVEQAELIALTAIDGTAGLLLSFSMAFAAFYFGANWDLLLTADLPATVLAEAKATRNAAKIAAIVLGALTLVAVAVRIMLTNHIMKTSRFVNVSP
ncbi:MAG: hypothetical protein JNJ73_00520 [Hyphomonadaceae bacterium]|nr:hypothetical protein [Hyphomonadaceae bacterium]